eukprot:scaffold25685_cov78-Phaeocystis_antarctica.AAC.4
MAAQSREVRERVLVLATRASRGPVCMATSTRSKASLFVSFISLLEVLPYMPGLLLIVAVPPGRYHSLSWR